MKKLIAIALAVVMVLTLSTSAVLAKPPSGTKGNSNNATVLLVSKGPPTWQPTWPGPFGQLKYNLSNPGGFQARLIVHGLQPNEWHMVTLQGEWPEGSDLSTTDTLLANSPDLWPAAIGQTATLGWADIALFKTDDEGNANVVVPTASGLTPGVSPGYPLAGLNTNPSLSPGTYTDVRVLVKWVGDGNGVFDATKLIWGTHPVLFEYQAMENFTVGP